MTESTYLITLKPRGRFFFGGDRAFTATGEAVYAAHSTYFPQQTALLGMLRLAVLRQFGLLEKPNEQAAYIGIGFDAEKTANLGKIKCLSPVFIKDVATQQDWTPQGMDFQDAVLVKCLDKVGVSFKNYDPKKGNLKNRWTNGIDFCSVDDFFDAIETVGNQKARDGQAKPDGYFKQTSYRFKRTLNKQPADLTFAFYATFSEEISFNKVQSVLLGADTSAFGFGFKKIEPHPASSTGEGQKVVLISDAYIENYAELQSHCDFILGETVPFRFMTSPIPNKYYQPNRSPKQYNLLARGTVLFLKLGQIDTVKVCLEKAEAFFQIGYNHYQVLEKS